MTSDQKCSSALSMTSAELRQYTGNLRQLASVRALRLDDGPEGGQRASLMSTGSGLDMWVLPDRSMDIGPLSWRGMPLAWQHPNGFVPPSRHSPFQDAGTGIERTLSGFLVTCGYDSVRHSSTGAPLHGSHTLTPARITRQREDWDHATPALVCEGEWTCAHLSRNAYRVQRRIVAPVGGNGFSLEDRIENIGHSSAPFDTLYHMNLGFPAVQGNMSLTVGSETLTLDALQDPLGSGHEPSVRCFSGAGAESLVTRFQRAAVDGWPALDMSLTSFCDELPWLQVWMDPRPGHRILALEPASSERNEQGGSRSPGRLAPGECKTLRLHVTFGSL